MTATDTPVRSHQESSSAAREFRTERTTFKSSIDCAKESDVPRAYRAAAYSALIFAMSAPDMADAFAMSSLDFS
jgi:hypothetical protein